MAKVKLLFKDHLLNKDIWKSKQDLFKAYYGAFYEFILNAKGGKEDLAKHNISSLEDFYNFADWYAGGMENCYGIGFAFHDYYHEVCENGKIEDQSQEKFIGYLYHNDKFTDFLNFLITFCAWWRNDEGCTRFVPYNHADDFFNSNWATLVDTSKLFYFTAETVYHWQSFRVKYALDNIPGVILSEYNEEIEVSSVDELPKIRVAGYEFKGWVDEEGNTISKLDSEDSNSVYANLVRKDFYNYWEKEEKTIYKEHDPNYKKVDPA